MKRLDLASLSLLLVGLAFAAFAYWQIAEDRLHPLIIVPSIFAILTGATHLTKIEAPHSEDFR